MPVVTPVEAGLPTTLEGWVAAFVPPASKAVRGKTWVGHVRALLGLDGAAPMDPGELAKQLAVSRQAIYISFGKAREYWALSPALPALQALVRDAVDVRGGVARLDAVAEDLSRAMGAS